MRDQLSGRELAIAAQVADLRLMSARQIEAIHFPSEAHRSSGAAARAARRSLAQLVDQRILVRLERRIGGIRAGSSGFVYGLGPVGHRLLRVDGPRRRHVEPSATFVAHTLAVGEVVTELSRAAQRRRLDVISLQTEPRCWRQMSLSSGGAAWLRPDLFAAIGMGDYEYRWFIELDLGTEHLPTLLRKCLQYERYYRTGTEQATHGVFPRVLWLMHNTDRASKLRAAIASHRDLTSALFVVGTADRQVELLSGGQP